MPVLVHPEFGPCYLSKPKQYPRISRQPFRNKYLHIAVWERVAGRPVREGFHVHHMAGKWCPEQLIEIEAALHPASTLRHPYTGRFMTATEFEREFHRLPWEQPA